MIGNIEGTRLVEEVNTEGVELPLPDLYWCDINLNDEGELTKVSFFQHSFMNFSLITTLRTMIILSDSTTQGSS